jgi:hypothetical protein
VIDFRYHIVSIIAVFLALGIGILVGTTVVNEAIVAQQSQLLRQLDERVKEEKAGRRAAEDELVLWNTFSREGTRFILGDRLAGRNVAFVTADGVPDDVVEGVVAALRRAGANVPALVVMTAKWQLREATAREQLRFRLGLPEDADLDAIYRSAVVNLAAKLGNAPPTPEQAPLVNPENVATLLGGLVADGFVEVRSLGGGDLDPNTIGGPDWLSTIAGADDVKVPLGKYYVPLTTQMALGGRTVAVQGSAAEGEPQEYMGAVRGDQQAMSQMSTVDNAQTTIGQIAAAIALQQTQFDVYEQLGTGPGSVAVLPTRAQ